MYLDWDWNCIPIRDQIQGNSEEYNFSVLVLVKGMRYFGDKKKKKDNANVKISKNNTLSFCDIFSLVYKTYSYNINVQEVFFKNFDFLM